MKSIAGRIGDDIVLSQLERREDALLDASNTIDTKASQLFAAGALLAVQPAVLLIQDVAARWIIWVQAVGCVFLFVVFYLAHDTLKVREYPAPLATEEWRDATIAQARAEPKEEGVSQEEIGCALLIWSTITGIRERIRDLEKIKRVPPVHIALGKTSPHGRPHSELCGTGGTRF